MLVGITPSLPVLYPKDIDSYTKTLLHFGGQPGSNFFSDDAAPDRAWTGYGYAQVTGSQLEAGTTCLDLRNQPGSYIDTPAHADFNVGSGDFTVDGWFIISGGTGTYRMLFGQGDNAQTASTISIRIYVNTDDRLIFTVNVGTTQYSAAAMIAAPTLNAWHHFAAVRYGDATQLFIDGVAQSGNLLPASSVINSSSNKFAIGRFGELDGFYFVGNIDEFRFSKGIARWTADFTPPSYYEHGYIGNDSYTKLLLHLDGPWDSTNATGTGFLDHSQPSKGYPFIGGNARIRNDVPKFGFGSCYFDGTGDYFWFPYSDDFNFGSGDFAIDCWVFPGVTNVQQMIASFGSNSSNCFRFFIFSDNTLYFDVLVSGTQSFAMQSLAGTFTANTWHHVAIVRYGNIWRLFVNGQVVATIVNSYAIPSAASGAFFVGANIDGGGSFNGYIEEFRVSKGVPRWINNFAPPKSAHSWGGVWGIFDPNTKLLLHFEGPNNGTIFTDYSAYARTFTAVNGAKLSTAAKKYGNASLLLASASAQYLSTPTQTDFDFGTGDFTIDWWEYQISAPSGGCVIARDGIGGSYQAFLAGYTVGATSRFYASSNGASWDIASAQYLGPIVTGEWHHRAVSRQGTTFRTFYDGVQQATWTSSLALQTMTTSLIIGRYGSTYFDGYIDELKVSKGISRFNANFNTGPGPYFN